MVALTAFSQDTNPLSYKYQKGDETFFEVSVVSKKARKKFGFITSREDCV